MVFNDNLDLLQEVKAKLGQSTDSLNRLASESPVVKPDQPYIVVSIEERRLWLKQGDQTLFTTQVATGSGKTYTACSFCYRLTKFARAKRILFLVDRNNLGRQTLKEFQQYVIAG